MSDLFKRSATKLEQGLEFVPKAVEALDGNELGVRLIAFYLPQFHPIPENDKWWGKGFTDWTNVAKAVPQFVGHYQPQFPTDLGFYDLLIIYVLRAQAELAKHYGIYGFCFHHYWFGRKRLLESPVKNLLQILMSIYRSAYVGPMKIGAAGGMVAIRRLISQSHSPADDIAFLEDIILAFRDSQYIRVGGRPLLIVYRATLLPDARATAARWKEHCARRHCRAVCRARSFDELDSTPLGFDVSVEFPPHQISVD